MKMCQHAALFIGATIILFSAPMQSAEAVEVRFNAFADVTVGYSFDDLANAKDAARQESDGLDTFAFNVNEGFGVVGTDFVVTADLTENLVYQAEVNLQVGRGGSSDVGLDLERMYLDYRISDAINIQAGLYFTPIGYHNRFLYSRAWLVYSIQVHDIFEEEMNLVPTHTVGVNLHGSLKLMDQKFKYVVGLGNSRQSTPTEVALARARTTFSEGDLEVTALIEWHAPMDDTLTIGLSGWTSGIRTVVAPGLGGTADLSTDPKASLREYGFNPYLTYLGADFNVIIEGVYSVLHDRKGNLAKKHNDGVGALTAEVSLNLMNGRMHPYLRYDRTWLPSPSEDTYYGFRRDGDEITQHYVAEFDALMVGMAFDWNANTRLKLEGQHHFSGIRRAWGASAQIAFGF